MRENTSTPTYPSLAGIWSQVVQVLSISHTLVPFQPTACVARQLREVSFLSPSCQGNTQSWQPGPGC